MEGRLARAIAWLRNADSAWFLLLFLVSPALLLVISSLLFLSCLAFGAAWPNEHAILAAAASLGLLLGLSCGWGLTRLQPARRGRLLVRVGFCLLAGGLGAKAALNFSLGWVPHQMRPAMLGGLSTLRDGIQIHYGETGGSYPAELGPDIPTLWPLPAGARFHAVPHPSNKEVQAYPGEVCAEQGALDTTRLRDTGKWGYVGDPDSPCPGRVFIDCTHTDSKGVLWASY